MASLYKMPVSKLNGIGPKKAELFKKLNINSIGELINFYPRTYENWDVIDKIKTLQYGGKYCIKAVVGTPFTDIRVSGGRVISKGMVYDDTDSIQIVFFNNKYISSMLKGGHEYYFYGKVTADSFGAQMVSPTFADINDGQTIHPVYRQTAGLATRNIASAVKQALALLPKKINDPLTEKVRNAFGLCDLKQALNYIHFPNNKQELESAKKRLVIEELVTLNLGMNLIKQCNSAESTIKIKEDYSQEFESLLPFELTKAQKKCVNDCINDFFNKPSSMNRLIQGDVGSGKTAVAGNVCYTVIKNGYQVAFMAPTEILAIQHYKTFSELFKNSNISVALLTGSLKESEKQKVRQDLKDGSIQFIVGTHALITDKTEFSKLGLVVTDEQHRFGVAQRAKLLSKGDNPHLLVMSATPIPRTLGLIVFGDLDISIINELPPNRKPVKTLVADSTKRHRIYEFIKKEIATGKQAYIVCPLVEEGEIDNVASAEEYAAELMLKHFQNISIGILHGQMKPSEKEDVMKKFANNEYSILVSTTVIEVGVDVPNSSIMLIENAERFGLSQLHQLRGRVGRGDVQSYCILMSDSRSKETLQRLNIIASTNDGFKVADQDLRLRGPGDFFGERQHGLPQLAIADFADTSCIELSQSVAEYILFTYKDINNEELRPLKAEINRMFDNGKHNILN